MTCTDAHFPAIELDTWSDLAPFPGCHVSCGTVLNGPTGSVVSFNIRQGLKCKHVASTPTLTMWLLCSNCARKPLNFGVYSQGQILHSTSRALSWNEDPLLNFPAKCLNFQDPKLSILLLWPFYVINISLTPDIFLSTFLQPVNGSKNSIFSTWLYYSSQLFLKLPIILYTDAAPDKWCTNYASAVRTSVGKAFSSELKT